MSQPKDATTPKRGVYFERDNYVPRFGDLVHMDWSPVVGSEMMGPHYGLVLSHTKFNIACGMLMAVPITTDRQKVSGFELEVQVAHIRGVALLSGLRTMDYRKRKVEFIAEAPLALVCEANRQISIVMPSDPAKASRGGNP